MGPAVDFQLDFTYEDRKKPALSGVSGEIKQGTCVVLCGSSGCGKSTLLRCMNRLIPQFYEGSLRGFCHLGGKDTKDLSIGESGRMAASVFQDPRSQFFTLNSSTEAAFALENFGYSQEEMEKRVELAFEALDLQRLKDRNVFALSSGERQLTAICAAWAMDTALYLLDEPTANLDLQATEQFRQLLQKLKQAGKTLVISEHRLSYLTGIADEYWIMKDGEVLKKLSAREMLSLSSQELHALGLRTTDLNQVREVHGDFSPEVSRQDHFKAENISCTYSGGRQVLKGLSLTAQSGEVIGLIGANGCGKTTFGKAAAGLLKISSGSFLLNGRALKQKALSAESIFIMQEAEFQFFTSSVSQELRYGVPDTEAQRQETEDLLKLTGLWELRDVHPFSLSGGQMQKLVLLMACLSEKPIVILDEPTAGLDYESLKICAELIKRMQKNRIVFLITHDPELISLVCTRCILLGQGKIKRNFDLSMEGSFSQVKDAMLALTPEAQPEIPKKKAAPALDPRVKLFMVLIAMVAGIYTDLNLITWVSLALGAAALYERRYGLVGGCLGSLGLILCLYRLFPTAGMSFLAHFFPRILLMAMGAMLIVSETQAPRTLAGLRKLHVPERAIMIFSIVFRFFPVLSGDVKILRQSMGTRGFFVTLTDKLKAIPEYLEMALVPMVFRVIRIAETLSASAETRGIALSGKRDSFIKLRFHPIDVFFAVLTVIFTVLGLLL